MAFAGWSCLVVTICGTKALRVGLKIAAMLPTSATIPQICQYSDSGIAAMPLARAMRKKPRRRSRPRASSQKSMSHLRGRWSASQPPATLRMMYGRKKKKLTDACTLTRSSPTHPPRSARAASIIIRSPKPLAAVLVHISVKLPLRQSGFVFVSPAAC